MKDWQPIPGDMAPDEGLILGGILYYDDEFVAGKVAFMRSSAVLSPGQSKGQVGLGLGGVYTWAHIKRVPRRELWGHCWIDERIADYRGARGPVWQRLAANDSLWIMFKQAEDLGLKRPSFRMIETVLLNSGPETRVTVEDIIPGLVLAEELGGTKRNANDDAKIMQLVCDVANQRREHGSDSIESPDDSIESFHDPTGHSSFESLPDEIVAAVRSIWTSPKIQSLRERALP